MTIILGSSVQVLVTAEPEGSGSQLSHSIRSRVLSLLGIAAAAMMASYVQTVCWMVSGQHVSTHIREEYLKAILRQEFEYIEAMGAGKVMTSISLQINSIQDAISQNTGHFISSSSTFLTAFLIAFARNWKLSIIVATVLPAMFIPISIMSRLASKNFGLSSEQSSLAHDIAADAILSIKVVQSLRVQDVMSRRYDDILRHSERFLFWKSFWLAAIYGWVYLVLYSTYGLAFWEGSRLVVSDDLDIGVVVNVLFAIVIGIFALGRVTRHFESFATAVAMGKSIFQVIGRQSPSLSSGTQKRRLLNGNILFENVTFSYASRPEELVLDDMTLRMSAGQTTAIVGNSGSGKSTIIGLLERFYEPQSGRILIDGEPITSIPLSDLRSQIALVSQEPTLFSTSIFENVCIGLLGTSLENSEPCEQERLVKEACRLAGISDFIETLPELYDSPVGTNGMLLSGGQRQRIAFARALIRNPRILLLDEPTSALDNQSESLIQAALEVVSYDRTIIIVAHRLDTIMMADSIVVIGDGGVLEQGTHQELCQTNGAYFSLLNAHRSMKRCFNPESNNEMAVADIEEHISGAIETAKHAKEVELPRARKSSTSTLHYLMQIQRLNTPERYITALGFFASVICGAAYPVQAFLFAKLMVLSTSPHEANFPRSATFFSLMFFTVAIAKFLSHFASSFILNICCDRMIGRVRSLAFKRILQRNIEWFHEDKHSTGRLIIALSEQSGQLAGLHGFSMAIFVEILTNIASGALVSSVIAWQYSLPVLSLIPLIMMAGYLRLLVLRMFQKAISEWHEHSVGIVSEAFASIKAVVALGRENQILQAYHTALVEASSLAFNSITRSSALFALSQSLIFLVNAFAIWYGARLIERGQIDLYQYFVVYIALTLGAQDAGEMVGKAPELALAKAAAHSVFPLMVDNNVDTESSKASRPTQKDEAGSIVFDDVYFAYQSRPQETILSGINITIQPGQHVGLVGPSGSGKSTILGLLAGFYQTSSGTIKLGGQELGKVDAEFLHSIVSLVPQDPVLFAGTIRFNILLGTSIEKRTSQEDLETACRQANIFHFIQSLPDGFDTMCSNATLSVGQKQRIMIARALVRNPQILLLDEPTASLDAHSVNHVLQALESAAKGRTTITIAHNLSTVLGVDVIYVVREGKILIHGNPIELLQNDNKFSKIIKGYLV